jgi:DNA replication protein DnaC
MADGEISLDLYEVFGETLESTTNRRSHISDLIWSYQIESEIDRPKDALSIDVLTKWLSPQDRVLEMLGSDHTTFTDQLAERTGLWFQENLTNFVKGSNECLLLTGPAGSGKTTLSAAIAERLQRPVARQSLQTIYVSIGTVQSEATSLHVVKSILYQLLSARVGNLAL